MENSSTMLVDVNGIREKVLAETTARGLVDDLPSFADAADIKNAESDLEKIAPDIKTMDSTKENYAFRPLSSSHKIIGKPIIFIKRSLRKLLKWYIEPICFQQTAFNTAATNAFNDISDTSKGLLAGQKKIATRVSALDSRVDDLQTEFAAKLSSDEATLESVHGDIEELKGIIDTLRQAIITANDDSGFWHKLSVSQSGEDAIVAYILDSLNIQASRCTYVDLGANHPKDMSNTYYLYKKGARGVLVEANPSLIPELESVRQGDIILNRCVAGSNRGSVEFYVLSGDGLSTTDKAEAEQAIIRNPSLHIEKVVMVETITFNEIIDEYLHQQPVLLNLDIEGMEMDILRSIDFNKTRPLIIIVETIPYEPQLVIETKNEDIVSFMREHDYAEYAFSGINSIFIDKNKFKK
jgi:FkbM family methyltransferase